MVAPLIPFLLVDAFDPNELPAKVAPDAICGRHPHPRNPRSVRNHCRGGRSSKSGLNLLRLQQGGLSGTLTWSHYARVTLFTARLTVRQISNLEFRFRRSLFFTWVRYRSSLPPLPWCWRHSKDSFRWTMMSGNTFRSFPITATSSLFDRCFTKPADFEISLP